jgi:hypothetical protein
VKKGAKRFQRLLALPSDEERAAAIQRLTNRKLKRVVRLTFLSQVVVGRWSDDEMKLRGLIGTAALLRFCGKGRGR